MERCTERRFRRSLFSRGESAALARHADDAATPEMTRLRSLHGSARHRRDRGHHLPLSRLFSLYVAATQRLFRAQRYLGTDDAKMPYVIGVGA